MQSVGASDEDQVGEIGRELPLALGDGTEGKPMHHFAKLFAPVGRCHKGRHGLCFYAWKIDRGSELSEQFRAGGEGDLRFRKAQHTSRTSGGKDGRYRISEGQAADDAGGTIAQG